MYGYFARKKQLLVDVHLKKKPVFLLPLPAYGGVGGLCHFNFFLSEIECSICLIRAVQLRGDPGQGSNMGAGLDFFGLL